MSDFEHRIYSKSKSLTISILLLAFMSGGEVCPKLSGVLSLTGPAYAAPTQKLQSKAALDDAFKLVLERNASKDEELFWIQKLDRSPSTVRELYESLTRLPEYQNKLKAIKPTEQATFLYRTIMRRAGSPSELKQLENRIKNEGLPAATEYLAANNEHSGMVYVKNGLITDKEWQQYVDADTLAHTDKLKGLRQLEVLTNNRIPIPEPYLSAAAYAYGVNRKLALEVLRLAVNRFPENAIAELDMGYYLESNGVQLHSFQRFNEGIKKSDNAIGADWMEQNMRKRIGNAKHPELLSLDILRKRALGHSFIDQFQNAATECTMALKMAPNACDLYSIRGHSHYELGNYQLAVNDFDKAVKLGMTDVWYFMERGISKTEIHDYKGAIPDLSKLIAISPRFRALQARSICYRNLHMVKEEFADLTLMLKLQPRNSRALLLRGEAYFENGKLAEAEKDIELAIKLRPLSPQAYILRSKLYEKQGKKAAAAADLKKAKDLNSPIE
ncbi:MAG: tetratricopeptide repeat protein [Leptolyngbya sp.]|nr:tetratricopeptide repeat protein [Candidatus Melainabacteria bacterium]